MSRTDRRLSPTEKVDARTALDLLEGTGLSLTECARRAIVGRRAGARIKFSDAHDRFVRSRMLSGARQATVDWYMAKLQPFVGLWHDRLIDSITRAELREAIAAQPVGDSTRAGYSRALSALWHWCAAAEPPHVGADVTHGLRMTPPRTHRDTRHNFLSVAETQRILDGLPQYRSAYAIQLFAGVRPEEVAGADKPRLLHAHVLTAERYIRVPDAIAKSTKARLIQRLPDAFWAWYEPAAVDAPISPVLSPTLRRAATRLLGRPLPFDAFRHTFVTYAVALQQDAAAVSLWVGHEGKTSLIHNTYMGLVTHAAALAYFALRPPGYVPPPAPLAPPTASAPAATAPAHPG